MTVLTSLLPLVVLAQGPARGQESTLPVRAVTLFSSGVAYTQREGEVSGNATVPLSFRTAQINDILKSLVLIDEKGKVQPAVYAAKDPVNRALQSFAVDVDQAPTLGTLLQQLRGHKVVVEVGGKPFTSFTNGTAQTITSPLRKIEGQVMSVDLLGANQGYTALGFVQLLLFTGKGVEAIPATEINGVTLVEEKLQKELTEALSLLATRADDKRRSVTLHFEGKDTRRVQVGYIAEAPLWKMSYRLLLSGVKASAPQPYLQGWALVENTTDEDWSGVQLTLVSGRPISFIQDLYQPQYLMRPTVGPDVAVSPRPQLAEAAVENRRDSDVAARAAIANSLARGQGGPMGRSAGGMGSGGIGGGGFGTNAPAPARPPGIDGILSSGADNTLIVGEALASSVAAQATGEKQGELFTYKIASPLSLPRQQAAMIPVVAQEITGEKVSLFNVATDARFALHAVRLKNNTGLHLKGGPVTLFDEGVYAGDARMQDIPPGDSRILSYAVDLGLVGEQQDKGSNTIETSLSIKRGVLIASRKETSEMLYTFRNKSDKPRQVLIEHPFDSQFSLVAPAKFDERTPSLYRFALSVPAGKTETLTVKTARPLSESYALVDADLNFIELTTQRKEGLSPKLKTALEDVLARRRKQQELVSQRQELETEMAQIEKDQSRIRQNMTVLERASESYKNYVKQLDEQELRLQSLRKQIGALRSQLAASERDLRAFLDKLEL